MNKRAQFFIIAALILSIIILSFGQVYTSSRVEVENTRVYDLSEEIQYETNQVLDNGFLTQQSQQVIEENLKNLTTYYASLNPDSDIDIVFGNETVLKNVKYEANTEDRQVRIDTLDLPNPSATGSKSDRGTGVTVEDKSGKKILKIKIVLDKKDGKPRFAEREFEIEEGKSFYLVVRKKVKNEDVVIYR